MSEFLYHALGLCGHVHHPSILNVTAIVAIIVVTSRIVYKRSKQ